MSIALENNLFALSLFHLCSCILCSILLQWKVTEQISLTIETVIVCPLQQFPPAQKKCLPRDGCFAVGVQLQLPCAQPKRPQSCPLKATCLETATRKRTHKNCFQLPTTPSSCTWQFGSVCANALFAAKLSDQQFSLAKLVYIKLL